MSELNITEEHYNKSQQQAVSESDLKTLLEGRSNTGMSWRKIKGKFVIGSNGVYKSFTDKELDDLKLVIEDIKNGDNRFYKEDNR